MYRGGTNWYWCLALLAIIHNLLLTLILSIIKCSMSVETINHLWIEERFIYLCRVVVKEPLQGRCCYCNENRFRSTCENRFAQNSSFSRYCFYICPFIFISDFWSKCTFKKKNLDVFQQGRWQKIQNVAYSRWECDSIDKAFLLKSNRSQVRCLPSS